jgi:glycosyltransferase involved in cell wall biosynthesis
MKVLLVVDGLEAAELSESGLWMSELAHRWVARGHAVDVVCVRPLEPWQEAEDVPGANVHRPGHDDLEMTIGECLAKEPDVVHVSSSGPFGPRVVEIAPDLPLLLDVHDYWPVCPNEDLLRRPGFVPCGEHFPFPGCGACAGLSRLRSMDERRELSRSARLLLSHSTFAGKRLEGGLERPVDVVPYGVDTERFRPDPEPPLSPAVAELFANRDVPRVMALGPPAHARGSAFYLDMLVAIHTRLPDVELVVAGRDPTNPDGGSVLQVEAHELGLGRYLKLLPRVPTHDLPALYASCMVAVAPSVSHEPGGLFVMQAMACGLPVIATPSGVLQDLIRQGEDGMLLPPRDVTAFGPALCAIMIDPFTRGDMGQTARLRMVEEHDLERTLLEHEVLYLRLKSGYRHIAAA